MWCFPLVETCSRGTNKGQAQEASRGPGQPPPPNTHTPSLAYLPHPGCKRTLLSWLLCSGLLPPQVRAFLGDKTTRSWKEYHLYSASSEVQLTRKEGRRNARLAIQVRGERWKGTKKKKLFSALLLRSCSLGVAALVRQGLQLPGRSRQDNRGLPPPGVAPFPPLPPCAGGGGRFCHSQVLLLPRL